MASKSPTPSPQGENSIEQALGRLESIVEEIEKTPPPLETLIDRYEEGMKLLQVCREKLDAAEKRIEIITRNSRGEPNLEPFQEL
jgi:exodeoxyribonuclease VII small subunit